MDYVKYDSLEWLNNSYNKSDLMDVYLANYTECFKISLGVINNTYNSNIEGI